MKTESDIKTWFQNAALILLAILLAGCNKENDYKLAFSHNLHVTENGIACADCHGKMSGGRFAAAGHAACKDCHGDWIETKAINAQTCGMCHKAKNLKELAKNEAVKAVSNEVSKASSVFRHSDVLTNRCADCHGMLMDKKLSLVPDMTRKEKVRIRDQAHRWGMNCTSCHADMDQKTPPPSHSQNWTRRHGSMGTQPDNACGVCHIQESCRQCHQVSMPVSHNNLWRTKTHGIQAAWNRAYCLVCHQEDSCTACHADTRPQSHNAGWAKNHCNNCHPSKSTGTGCTLCHETDIGSHPNPHAAGWRSSHCNSCHPGSLATAQCGVCHAGQGQIGSHPNPHAAGWRSSHCNSCHAGTPEAEKCNVCHAGGIAGHPNPHAAGWQTSHCYSCHPGTPAADQCAVCHAGGSSLLVHQNVWPDYHNRFGGRVSVNICYDCHEATPSAKLRLRASGGKTGATQKP